MPRWQRSLRLRRRRHRQPERRCARWLGVDSAPVRTALAGLIPAAVGHISRHQVPRGPLLAVLVVLALLYVAWRAGRLRMLGSKTTAARVRGGLRDLNVRPTALVPTLVLVIVIVVLLIAH